MKTSTKSLLLCTLVCLALAFGSWNRLNNSTKKSYTSELSYLPEKNPDDLMDELNLLPEVGADVPTAEDVLIQRIPGDNNHVLMMAFYSKENYSGPSFSIENGGHVVLRDDGNGYDKKAGDGLYTARVAVDLNEFRQKAISLTARMKSAVYKPIRFDHRAMIVDPDADESFDMEKWEKGEAVSISGLTNALGDLDIPNNAISSASSTHTVLSNNSASTVSVDASVVDDIRANCVTITDLAVVEDPSRTWNSCAQTGNIDGPWTFKTIMKELASTDPAHKATDAQVSDFVKNWLANWATARVINGDTVAARIRVNRRILNPWLTKSRNAGAPPNQLDMHFAPFKLLAIVNRFDLRDGGVHGIPGSAVGEGRYVFGLINSDCTLKQALTMGVILEYGVNKLNTCDARKAWAQQWVNLRTLTRGSPGYNQALQNITDQYSLCGSNPNKPNQSSLDQLRTDENALSGGTGIWEMREFVLDPGGSGFLIQNTVAQNPADKYDA